MNRNPAGHEPSVEALQAELQKIKRSRSFGRALAGTFYGLVTVVLIALALSQWFPVLLVRGNAMAPALRDGELALAMRSGNWDRGDLIAFSYGERMLVKRVIAGPGDVVEVDSGGYVFVNGEYLQEDYVQNLILGEGDVEYPYQVPDGRWFVLGDDRSLSLDSRSTTLGCVAQEQIVGRVIARIWPLDRLAPL